MSTLTLADRDLVQRALDRYARPDLRLVADLVGEQPRSSKNERRREFRRLTGVGHCVYCGVATASAGACHAHSDLPGLDPSFMAVAASAIERKAA